MLSQSEKDDVVEKYEELRSLLLHTYGARGKGLVDDAEKIQHRAPSGLIDLIRPIAEVRNIVQHPKKTESYRKKVEQIDLTRYFERCKEAKEFLESLKGFYREDPPGSTFRNLECSLLLDGQQDGSNQVCVWGDTGGFNQRWIVRQVGNGLVALGCRFSMRVLDTWPDGEYWRLQTHPFHGRVNQQWRLHLQPDGSCVVQSESSGLVLDVYQADGGWCLHCHSWHGGPNQRWYVNFLLD